jgi:translation initiation factor 2B subunit (eIF-2B alpha/beta/delta family)/8-oxo-dGTP pyrophosphatase MutT (NUDIX family)
LEYKNVVTAFLLADEKILLLKRSGKVGTNKGKWAAVSGYLEAGEDPLQRAQIEIIEELGLRPEHIRQARAGEILRAYDEQTNTVWVVHPFLFHTQSMAVTLDWESTEYRWIQPNELRSYETVPKLEETLDRVRCNFQSVPEKLSKVLAGIDALAGDKVHGASTLGRSALQLLAATTEISGISNTTDEVFCNLLFTASKLRKAQPAMANVRNLVGMLLFSASEKKDSVSTPDYRKSIRTLAEEIAQQSSAASEDASRNAAAILPENGSVLTHSYSSTVLRALELGMKGGKQFVVYATESYPGMEGKNLAKALVGLGVPVTLIADSAIGSIIPSVQMVLVGADSILTDGSLLHKVGTKRIADAANKRRIPLYSACESIKFSTADFLGEPIQASTDLFDVTPSQSVSQYVTESGTVEPAEVESRIRLMLKEIYP